MKSIRFNILQIIIIFTVGITNTCHSINWNTWNPWYVDPLRLKLSEGTADPCYLNNDGTTIDPSIQILESISEGERYGVCHNYAISKTLGLIGKIPETFSIAGCQDWYTDFNFLGDYCQKVTQPQKGDLVIYRSWRWGEILHTGLVHDYDEGLVESKWGINQHVLIHSTLSVPEYYGSYVEYYRPVKSNNEIIDDMHCKIDNFRHFTYLNPNYHPTMINTKEFRNHQEKWLLYTVNKKMNFIIETSNGELQDARIIDLNEALRRGMGLHINTTNENNQTPLILSAKHNNFDLAKLFITYKANINHQDRDGNTALIIAAKYDHLKMRQLLLEQKDCNKKLRDHEGNKASDYTFQKYPLLLSLKRTAKGIKDFGLL